MFHYIRNKLTQAQIIAMGYFLVITVGTLLLMLPAATRSGEMATPLTALFTATSATCVTGLVVVDTASYWSVFGQCIIREYIFDIPNCFAAFCLFNPAAFYCFYDPSILY